MRKLVTFLVLLLASVASIHAQQNPFMNDANGRPLYWGANYVPDGTPYFHEQYNWADITTLKGTVYKDVRVKYNLLDRVVQYLHDDGSEMVTTLPIKSVLFKSITIDDQVNMNVLLQNDSLGINTPSAPVYQVLVPGRISLMKLINVSYRDEKKYGEAVITRHFDRKETDYIRTASGEYKKLDKSRGFITELLQDKKAEVDGYIDSNKIKCRSTRDFQMILGYYNSLFH